MTESVDINYIKPLTGGDGFYERDSSSDSISVDFFIKLSGNDSFNQRVLIPELISSKTLREEDAFHIDNNESIERPTYCGNIYSCPLKNQVVRPSEDIEKIVSQKLILGELEKDVTLEYSRFMKVSGNDSFYIENYDSDLQNEQKVIQNKNYIGDKYCSKTTQLGTVRNFSNTDDFLKLKISKSIKQQTSQSPEERINGENL